MAVGRPHKTPHPARDHCLAPARSLAPEAASHRYTRMFPSLPHLDIDASFLHAIGRACDVRGRTNLEARSVAAGWPIFGQFIAHDITADRSPVTHHDDSALIRNIRSARLNLEALYGEGPVGNPYLYASAPTRRSCCSTATTCRGTPKASRSWAIPARTCTG